MRHLHSVILIVLFVFLPSCKYFKNTGLFGRKARMEAAFQARLDSVMVADSIRKIQEMLLSIENEKLDSVRNVDEERLIWENKFKFNIIVGSFVTPVYAEGLAEGYRKLGYDARIIRVEGNKFELVSVEAHESFRNAFARLKEFQDTVELNAWLYIKE